MEDFVGMIKIFAGSFAPKGWLFCQGQLLQVQQYQAVFAILGNNYGGDGKTTFALPDLRGRMPICAGVGNGVSPVTLAAKEGAMSAPITAANLPAHTHDVIGSVQMMVMDLPANTDSPAGNYLAQPSYNAYLTSSPSIDFAGDLNVNLNVVGAGGSTPLSVLPPYIGANFIICMSGYFPSRN